MSVLDFCLFWGTFTFGTELVCGLAASRPRYFLPAQIKRLVQIAMDGLQAKVESVLVFAYFGDFFLGARASRARPFL